MQRLALFLFALAVCIHGGKLVPKSLRQTQASVFVGNVARPSLLAAAMAIVVNRPSPARAGLPFFASEEQGMVDSIAAYQKPVFELLDQLRPSNVPSPIGVYAMTQVLKGGKEDSNVVLGYLSSYISPLQKKMSEAAGKLKLPSSTDQERLAILPSLMKGHILELEQAINEMKAESQAKEVEEVQETLAEFLKIASTNYEVKPFVPTRPLSDAELFGPLGCEFWGKKRVEGSNACASN